MELSTESSVRIRDGFLEICPEKPQVIWPREIVDENLRLAMTRANYLRSGVNGSKARSHATPLSADALWAPWFKEKVLGSRVRMSICRTPDGVFLLVAYSDTFEPFTNEGAIRI